MLAITAKLMKKVLKMLEFILMAFCMLLEMSLKSLIFTVIFLALILALAFAMLVFVMWVVLSLQEFLSGASDAFYDDRERASLSDRIEPIIFDGEPEPRTIFTVYPVEDIKRIAPPIRLLPRE